MNSCQTKEKLQAECSLPDRPFVGVFDSGVGGLSVLARFLDILPLEDYVYIGDSCHAPYGDRSPAELFELGGSMSLWLKDKGAKAIAIACNTISSTLITEIRSLLAPLPVYSILEAGVNAAVQNTRSQKIGVIATATTTNSQSFVKGIKELLPDAQITGVACPAFVPLVENGLVSSPAARTAVAEVCSQFSDKDIDTLLIGCTHYPALIPLLKEYLPDKVVIVDPAIYYAQAVAADLQQARFLQGNSPDEVSSKEGLTDMDSSSVHLPGGDLPDEDYSSVHLPGRDLPLVAADCREVGRRLLLTTGDPDQFQESGTLLFGQVPEPVFRIDYRELERFSPLNTAHGRALAEQIPK